MTRLALLLTLGWILCSATACKRKVDDNVAKSTSVTSPSLAPKAPVDHLAPGELIEGTEKVFGITLPRGMRWEPIGPRTIRATTEEHKPAVVVEYMRKHLPPNVAVVIGDVTRFEHLQVPGQPGREMTVSVLSSHVNGTIVNFEDITPPPRAENVPPTEAARWKAVGLSPTGKILDPTHLQ